MLSSSTRTVRLRATANGRQNRRHSRFPSVCPTEVATVLLLYARKRVKLETRPPPGQRSFVFPLYTLIEYTCKRLHTVGTTKYKYRNTKNPLPRDLSSPAAAANDAKADVYKYEFIRAAENTITKFFVLFSDSDPSRIMKTRMVSWIVVVDVPESTTNYSHRSSTSPGRKGEIVPAVVRAHRSVVSRVCRVCRRVLFTPHRSVPSVRNNFVQTLRPTVLKCESRDADFVLSRSCPILANNLNAVVLCRVRPIFFLSSYRGLRFETVTVVTRTPVTVSARTADFAHKTTPKNSANASGSRNGVAQLNTRLQ